MTTTEVQSARMEEQLDALRSLFQEARENENHPLMMQTARIITQQEREIEKMKIREGKYLARDKIEQMRDEFFGAMIAVAREFLPEEKFNEYMDEVVVRVSEVWKG